MTPDELLMLPDAVSYELVQGHLVERHSGALSSAVATTIGTVLGHFMRPKRLGHLFTADCGYRCFADDPGKVRKPDISYVRAGRLPNDRPPQGYILVAPDLGIEVLSPGDLAYEVDEKVKEYLDAGVKLISIVNPKTRTVRIHRPTGAEGGPISLLKDSDTITGESVLPGFSSPVAEFFDV
jgi:Uma2 family endonuclease